MDLTKCHTLPPINRKLGHPSATSENGRTNFFGQKKPSVCYFSQLEDRKVKVCKSKKCTSTSFHVHVYRPLHQELFMNRRWKRILDSIETATTWYSNSVAFEPKLRYMTTDIVFHHWIFHLFKNIFKCLFFDFAGFHLSCFLPVQVFNLVILTSER